MGFRKFVFFVLSVCMALQGWGRNVSVEQALQLAEDFYFSKTSSMRPVKRIVSATPRFELVYVAGRQGQAMKRGMAQQQDACYYVVNVNENDGFVVVSADDRALPVLAYSLEGSFDAASLPANCQAWLQGYEEEISILKNIPEEAVASPYWNREADYPSTVVAPMIQTTWTQAAPYNLWCPEDVKAGKGELSLVGCVATAVAQLMRYHRWPERPEGTVNYWDGKQQMRREMDFGKCPEFDWDNMLDRCDYNGGTELQRIAVANLSQAVGYACQMNYSKGESTAYLVDAALAMRKHFGYDANIHRHIRALTPFDEWLSLLMGELEAGRPVLYDGFNHKGGHAFLCDGYDGAGLFHFNWGWGGSSDGYYALSAMNPRTQGLGGNNGSYAFLQTMVCGIQPPTGTSVSRPDRAYLNRLYMRTPFSQGQQNLEDGVVEAPRGEEVGVSCWLELETLNDVTTPVCAGIWRDGKVVPLSKERSIYIPAGVDLTYYTSPLYLSSLTNGVYEVCMFCKDEAGEWKQLESGQADASTFRLTIGTDKVRMEKNYPDFRVALGEDFVPGILYTSGLKTWTLHVSNPGAVRLETWVGVRMQNETEKIDTLFATLTYCESLDQVSVDVLANMKDIPSGTYKLTPFYCAKNTIYAKLENDIVVPLAEPVEVTTSRKPQIDVQLPFGGFQLNAFNGDMTVKISQPSKLFPYAGRIYAEIFRKTASGNEPTGVKVWSEWLDLPKPVVKEVLFSAGQALDLPLGTDYQAVFYYDDGYGTAFSSGDLTVIRDDNSVSPVVTQATVVYRQEVQSLEVEASRASAVDVLSLSGRVECAVACPAGIRTQVPLDALAPGIYLVRVKSGSQVEVHKFVIP